MTQALSHSFGVVFLNLGDVLEAASPPLPWKELCWTSSGQVVLQLTHVSEDPGNSFKSTWPQAPPRPTEEEAPGVGTGCVFGGFDFPFMFTFHR